MQQTLEQRSSLEVQEHSMEKGENEGRRMMARMTNENNQSLQSRLLKRARGFIQTVDEEVDDNDMESIRSLKADDHKPGDAAKEDKPDDKPDGAKKDDKPHDKPDDAAKEDKPDDKPDDAAKDDKPDDKDDAKKDEKPHDKPDDAKKDEKPDDKPDDAKKDDKPDNKSDDAKKEAKADAKPAHPAPEKPPSKEGDSNRDGKVESNESPETTSPSSPAEDKPAEVAEDANPEVEVEAEVEESSTISHKNPTSPGAYPSTYQSSPQKSGKASKGKTSTCGRRLDIAYNQMRLFPKVFGVISSPEDVTAQCAFNSTTRLNFGCPFTYYPQQFGFAESEAQYQVIYNDPPASGTAYWNFALYCQCYQAYDLNCGAKIPHGPPASEASYPNTTKPVNSYSSFIPYSTPEKRLEYCQMVGVWNGDFDRSLASTFSNEIRQCGCYFIGTAKDMVGTCPGVALGAFYGNQGNTVGIAQQESIQYTDAEGTYYPTISPSSM